jgi:exodeoxyribonuclease VII large subunit
MPQDKVYSVTEITAEIKRVIHEGFGTLWIEGELSGYKRYPSGHHYFTLKDAGAQIPCAMWKMNANRLTFTPSDGMRVQVFGNLEVYEPAGRYQLIAILLRPQGAGELARAFDALVKKLEAEGLFDLAHKRPLPAYPERIGIVTSPAGAVIQDMRTVAARRWPAAELRLAPVRVQGAGAAQEIVQAIEALNREGDLDIIVIGRGGGSLEDLWPFNEEIVARAIYHSKIPIVSAVGHEVDFTVSDLVADLRAPTPSAAMELILPDREEVAEQLTGLKRRLAARRNEQIRHLRNRLQVLSQHWALRQPANLVHMAGQRLDELRLRLSTHARRTVDEKQVALRRVTEILDLLHPQTILQRGYAFVRDSQGRIVSDSRALNPGDRLAVTFAKGSAEADVIRTSDKGLLDEPTRT